MCGIFGEIRFDPDSRVDEQALIRATKAMVHRGPDDEGYYVDGQVGLGFRRLSIIDLASGHQPMANPEGTVNVVFNGEIYNFPGLRRELESHGHRFRTRSDTEVIIHGYEQWGEEVLGRLKGMFGLAIWDTRSRKLVIARDSTGIKLVYFNIRPQSLVFSSEVFPIYEFTEERPEIEPVSLNLYLRFRYTPSPLTVYKGIMKLPPGTKLVVENGTWKLDRWYDFTPTPFQPMVDVEKASEELRQLYLDSVKRHLISDVEVGLLLSGGVDSTLLLSLMNENGGPWKTYSVGYGQEYSDDELGKAGKTAREMGADHHSILLSQEDFENTITKIVGCLEEPIASSSIVPMYHVCQSARKDVKVALIGQGPDELFGGYVRHLGIFYGSYWRMLPSPLRAVLASVIRRVPRSEALKRGIASLDAKTRFERYRNAFSLMEESSINGLLLDEFAPERINSKVAELWGDLDRQSRNLDELGGFQYLEVFSALPDELLMYADKLSMAHSLELRVPYLDREVVEYVQKLDSSFKIRHGERKWLHRRVARNMIPGDVLRRKKIGFAVNAVDSWFRRSLSGKMKDNFLDDSSMMYRYLKPAAVRKLFHDHRANRCDNHKVLFSLVVFEEMLRVHSIN